MAKNSLNAIWGVKIIGEGIKIIIEYNTGQSIHI
jgi:hypothetical protein